MHDKDRDFIEKIEPAYLKIAIETFQVWQEGLEYKLTLFTTTIEQNELLLEELKASKNFLKMFWTDPRTRGQVRGVLSGHIAAYHYSDEGMYDGYLHDHDVFIAGLCLYYCHVKSMDWLNERLSLIAVEMENENPTGTVENEAQSKGPSVAKQVLILRYLFQHFNLEFNSKSSQADFIRELTGRDWRAINDCIGKPFETKGGKLRVDEMMAVKDIFIKADLGEIAKMVSKDLE